MIKPKEEKIEFIPKVGKNIKLKAGVRYWLVSDDWISQERQRVLEKVKDMIDPELVATFQELIQKMRKGK